MAASSSEAYDVFLSFRGEDTHQNLISHLYAALREKGIRVFLDNEGIMRGDQLSPTLLAAIERSGISIIIFSEDFASSPRCLDELAKVIECRNARGQIVLPIFYNVPPSHVRNQMGKYQTAFVEHEKCNQFKVQKWKDALREAANLAGWDSTKTRSDFELVTSVVENVRKKLQTDLAVDYAGGNPLAPKVLGSYLRREWESALEKLKKSFAFFFFGSYSFVVLVTRKNIYIHN